MMTINESINRMMEQKRVADEIKLKTEQVHKLVEQAKEADAKREKARAEDDILEVVKQNMIINGLYSAAMKLQKEAFDLKDYYVNNLM